MKQHITVKQLNELSKKGKEKYYTFIVWDRKEIKSNFHFTIKDLIEREGLILLSIGQMIEFLDEKKKYRNYFKKEGMWYVSWNRGTTTSMFFKRNLCDALWEAVKEILNE